MHRPRPLRRQPLQLRPLHAAQDALDAAFAALDQRLHGIPGDLDPFSHPPGTFSCHIHYPARELRHLVGSCTTALRMQGGQAAEVSFIERWRPSACRHGCSVRLSWRSHLWRVRESDDGWQVAISSSGDPPPQFPNGVSR